MHTLPCNIFARSLLSACFTALESLFFGVKTEKKSLVLAQMLIEIYFTMIKTESFYIFPTTEVISRVKISSCKKKKSQLIKLHLGVYIKHKWLIPHNTKSDCSGFPYKI